MKEKKGGENGMINVRKKEKKEGKKIRMKDKRRKAKSWNKKD